MKFWILLSLSVTISFIESVVLVFMVLMLSFVLGDSTYIRGTEVFIIMPLFFLMYKSILELWIFMLIVLRKNKKLVNSPLELRDLKVARMYALIPAMLLLIFGSFDNPDMFLRLAILYIPSVFLSYCLTHKLWEKGLRWIYG